MDVQGGGVVMGDGSSGQGCWRGEADCVTAVRETCRHTGQVNWDTSPTRAFQSAAAADQTYTTSYNH